MEQHVIRSVGFAVVALTLAASPALAQSAHKKGVAKGRSTDSAIAACGVAKTTANRLYCGKGAVDKEVSACDCTVDSSGTWTCSVDWVEVCRTGRWGKSSYAWTGTMSGQSHRTMNDACYAAEVENKRVACPTNTLKRELNSCECEWIEDAGRWSCLMDQTLWCHR